MLSFPVRKGPRDQSTREAQSRQPQGGPALAEYGQSLVPLFSYPPPSITLESSSRKKRPPPTYDAGRVRMPLLAAFLLLGRLHGARAKRDHNLRITGAAPRRRSVLAPHYPCFRCGGSDRRLILAGRHHLP